MLLGGASLQTAKIVIGCAVGIIFFATIITFTTKWEDEPKIEPIVKTIIQPCPPVNNVTPSAPTTSAPAVN
jgi:hypothetical protein